MNAQSPPSDERQSTTFETDWLASRPVFYNDRTGKVSYTINEVIDFSNVEFHPEGLNNYLEFGYSILGQTPVKHVKFLPHSSRLTVSEDGTFDVERLVDPVEAWVGKTAHEDDVWHLLSASVKQWENSVQGNIIIPTSGGYDSRLLNLLIQDKSRIRAFTYGLSEDQSESFEVIYAQKISEILGIRWEHIPLHNIHRYFDDWDSLYGISTHAHGMYHIDFYTQILSRVKETCPLLSGIIGDAWAGSVYIPPIYSQEKLIHLGYTHGIHADPAMSLVEKKYILRERYYLAHKKKLISPLFLIVEAMRFKVILLSYLLRIPQYVGFYPWSPFLIQEIALSMLSLPWERRKNRRWQQEFFQNHGLDIESKRLQASYQNTLDLQAMRRIVLKPLDGALLQEIIRPKYVAWINSQIAQQGMLWNSFWGLQNIPKFGGALRYVGIKDQRLKAYNAYLTLKPIENLLRKREKAMNPCV